MAGNEVRIVVRETGSAETANALTRLQSVGVGVGAGLGIAMAAMAASAGASLAGLGKSSVDAASNMAESMSKARVVFGQASSGIESFAKDAAKNMGFSNQAALEMAGTFGNLFTSMGISRDASAGMSKGILQLGADLGSFNNIPVQEALEKIRAGLVGESEPLRALGVNLNAATIEAEAMRLGLFNGVGAIDASAKAQAAYSLIMQQTTNAQGDFARTSDGLANQQKKLAANVEDLKTKFGSALLPVVTEVTSKLGALIEQNGDKWASDFANAVGTATTQAEHLFDALDKLVKSSPFQVTVNTVFGALTGNAHGGGAGGEAISQVWKDQQDGASVWQRMLDALALSGSMGGGAPIPDAGPLYALHAAARRGTHTKTQDEIDLEAELGAPRGLLAGLGGLGGGAAGGGGGGGGGKNALQSAWEQIHETLLNELIRGGESQVSALQESQGRLLDETTTTAQRMATILGVDLGKTLLPAFESIRDREKELASERVRSATEAAKALLKAEQDLAEERRKNAYDLFKTVAGNGGGANIALMNAIATGTLQPGQTYGTPGSGVTNINVHGDLYGMDDFNKKVAEGLNQAAQQTGPVLSSGVVQP